MEGCLIGKEREHAARIHARLRHDTTELTLILSHTAKGRSLTLSQAATGRTSPPVVRKPCTLATGWILTRPGQG